MTLLGNPLSPFGGLRIVDTEAVGDPYEDWSGVRSHARAARRRKLGHPQRIVTRYRANGKVLQDQVRGVIYIHPHDRMKLEQMMRAPRP
jgi:hypothetical protein